MRMTLIRTIVLVFCMERTAAFDPTGHEYYNDRYAVGYLKEDSMNGLYDQVLGYTQLLTGNTSVGCVYDDKIGIVTSCSGTTVVLGKLNMPNITAGTFNEGTRSITIYSCSNFKFFENKTFENVTSLETLLVQNTGLEYLPDLSNTKVKTVFTIEAWVYLDSNHTTGPYPVFCANSDFICLSVVAGNAVGRYGNYTVTSSQTLSADQWYDVIFRYRIEAETLAIFVDSVSSGTTDNVKKYNLTVIAETTNLKMYIGRDSSNYFRGTIDEVRIYNEGLQDDEIRQHVAMASVQRPVLKSYNTLHFRMEDSMDSTTLMNSGKLMGHTAIRNGGVFVTSYEQFKQFRIGYPNNR